MRNKSIIWFLFNALNVSSVYTPDITSTRLTKKIAVKQVFYLVSHQDLKNFTSAPDDDFTRKTDVKTIEHVKKQTVSKKRWQI